MNLYHPLPSSTPFSTPSSTSINCIELHWTASNCINVPGHTHLRSQLLPCSSFLFTIFGSLGESKMPKTHIVTCCGDLLWHGVGLVGSSWITVSALQLRPSHLCLPLGLDSLQQFRCLPRQNSKSHWRAMFQCNLMESVASVGILAEIGKPLQTWW